MVRNVVIDFFSIDSTTNVLRLLDYSIGEQLIHLMWVGIYWPMVDLDRQMTPNVPHLVVIPLKHQTA